MHRRDWLRAAILGICLATSYAVDALAQYNPTLVPRVPSVAFVTSGTTGHLKQYKQFYLAAYGNGSAAVNDGGEGTFTQVTSCSDDLALTCIHDADGIAFHRDNTNGDLRQMGVTLGSVYDGAATSPSNPASVVSLLNTAAPILLGLGITTIHTGAVNLHLGTNYTLPADMTLDCDANQGGQRINSDYRYVTAHGILAHPSTTDLKYVSSDRAKLKNCLVERSDGSFAPTISFPTNMRDSLTAVSQFAGTGITIDDTDSPYLEDVVVVGFDKGVYAARATGSLQRPNFNQVYVDSSTGFSIQDIGSDGQITDVRVQSLLTEQPHNNSSDYLPAVQGQIDNLLTDGSGHYKVVTELPTTDPGGMNAGEFLALQTGDPIEVQTKDHGTDQAQSANGGWTAGTVTIIHSPTDGCAVANCQEVVLTGTVFGPVVSSGVMVANSNAIRFATGSDLAHVMKGQTVAGATCIPANTLVEDRHIWPDGTGTVWIQSTPGHDRAYTTCAVTENVTFNDVAFSSITADDEVIINSKVRSGPAFEFINDAGLRIFGLHGYEHKTGLHLGHDVGNLTMIGASFGLGDATPDTSFVSILMDGTDTDKSARRCHIMGMVASQHYPNVIRINSPDALYKPCKIDNVGLGSGIGDIVGSSIDVQAGALVLSAGGGGHDNLFVSAGTDLTLTAYHGNDAPAGGGAQLYVQDSTATLAGCGNTGIAYMTVGASTIPVGQCLGQSLSLPWQPAVVTGNAKAWSATDCGYSWRRSNAGGAMADTLPDPTAAPCQAILLKNDDATATDTITVGGGLIDGSSALALAPGRRVLLTPDASGYRTMSGDNNAGLLSQAQAWTAMQTFSIGSKTGTGTVASLPICNAGNKSLRLFVTDSNAALTAGIGAVVANGGANNVPVICDGAAWRIG